MFADPMHPKIVHIPIALSVLMPLLSIGFLVAWWREALPGRIWFATFALQAILVGGAWFAMETGEQDEEAVEQVLASEAPLEEHEERAEQFFWISTGVLGLMFLPLVVPGRKRKLALALAASVGTLGVFWSGYRVGEAGGALVYEHGAADAHLEGSAPPVRTRETHDEDDD